jgi:hypothetical protein
MNSKSTVSSSVRLFAQVLKNQIGKRVCIAVDGACHVSFVHFCIVRLVQVEFPAFFSGKQAQKLTLRPPVPFTKRMQIIHRIQNLGELSGQGRFILFGDALILRKQAVNEFERIAEMG